MKLRWTKAAKADLDAAYARLSRFSPTIAGATIHRIQERMQHVRAFPGSCPLTEDGETRRCFVVGTGYLVYYRVLPDMIVAEAVFHHRQDRPAWVSSRLSPTNHKSLINGGLSWLCEQTHKRLS